MSEPVWDRLSAQLVALHASCWALPYDGMTARTEIAVMFSQRVHRRTAALTLLFQQGLYDQAVCLVRSAYEDWLTVATILCMTQSDDQSAATQFREDVAKTEASLYKAFGALAGSRARAQHMANPPDRVLELSHKKQSELRVSGKWANKADDLGLRAVHDFVYPYLSELSHGNFRNYEYLFVNDDEAETMAPTVLERSAQAEDLLALWAYWFQLRTLTICARERGQDLERNGVEFLAEFKRQGKSNSLETACFQRERCE